MKKVFISHSSKDKYIAEQFVHVLLGNGLSINDVDVFCSSAEGMKVTSGDDWRESVRDNLMNALVVVLIITPHYKESEICLNEMGAAWVLNTCVIPLVVEPINFSSIGPIHEVTQVERLLSSEELDRVKDVIQEKLSIPAYQAKTAKWNARKKVFIHTVQQHIQSNPFPTPLSREALDSLQKQLADEQVTVSELVEEISELEEMNKALVSAKDKDEVKAIQARFRGDAKLDELKNICADVRKLIVYMEPIVIGVIYSSFIGNIEINAEGFDTVINNAVAEQIIDKEDGLRADFESTIRMRKVRDALIRVDEFIKASLDDHEFVEEFEQEYEYSPSLRNVEFWRDVMELKVYID